MVLLEGFRPVVNQGHRVRVGSQLRVGRGRWTAVAATRVELQCAQVELVVGLTMAGPRSAAS